MTVRSIFNLQYCNLFRNKKNTKDFNIIFNQMKF